MSQDSSQDALGRAVLTLQIVIAAMVTGCAAFLVVALLVVQFGGGQRQGGEPILTVMALAVAAVDLAVRMVVPRMIVERGRRAIILGTGSSAEKSAAGAEAPNLDAARLARVFQAKTIAGAALFEGAALLLLLAYLIEHSPWSLIAALVMMVGIALHLPTRLGLVQWTEDQMDRIRKER